MREILPIERVRKGSIAYIPGTQPPNSRQHARGRWDEALRRIAGRARERVLSEQGSARRARDLIGLIEGAAAPAAARAA